MATTPQFPQANVDAVRASLNKYGLTNPALQAGILATIAKETGFVLRPEIGYSKTSNERIRKVFAVTLKNYTDVQLTVLKADDRKFFDATYGGRYGNTAPGDGYKYRGRGFTGVTFKDNYARYGKLIGRDLVADPDLLNQVPIAADALAAYYVDQFAIGKKSGKLKAQIGVDDVSEIKDPKTATKAAVQATAGWGGTFLTSPIGKENHDRALSTLDYFIAIVGGPLVTANSLVKKKFIPVVLTLGALGFGLFLLLKK